MAALALAARENWRYWSLEWAVIATITFCGLLEATFDWKLEEWVSNALILSFPLVGLIGCIPWMRGQVGYWPLVFWIMLLPFISAVILTFVWHGVVGVLRA